MSTRVQKMRSRWKEQHGTSYQAVVKWVNSNGACWKNLSQEEREKWHESYKKVHGYR